MASARAFAMVMRRHHAVAPAAWRTYTTPSRPPAAQATGSSSDLMEELSELAQRLPRTERASAALQKSRGNETPEPVPPHPEWVLGNRPQFFDPPIHPKPFGIHVATLSFTAYNPDKSQLALATGFALQAAWHLGIPCTRPASYPTRRELHTVLRSGFVHKKSQENFWRLTHKRVIRAYDANEEVINRWINYLTDECIAANVSIKADRITYRPLKWGDGLEAEAARVREVRSEEAKRDGRASPTSPRKVAPVSTEEQVRALAEELIEKELAPRAEAAERQLEETGTGQGKALGTLEEVEGRSIKT